MRRIVWFLVVLILFVHCGTSYVSGESLSLTDVIDTSGEEKVYSTATLADDFAEDTVLVALTNTESLNFKTSYGPGDFPEISCTGVSELTPNIHASTVQTANELESVLQLGLWSTTAIATNSDIAKVGSYHRKLVLTLEETGKQQVLDAIAALEAREDVLYAEPNYILQLASTTPNDEYYASQYACAAINLPDAWDITTGSFDVFVGVVDSGIDSTHPDLFYRVRTDLFRDFVGDGYSASQDPVGHGTEVAGIIGATGNNHTGVSGVCWQVKLVSLRVANEYRYANAADVCDAIDYAAGTLESSADDIRILNLSLGYDSSTEFNWISFAESAQAYNDLGGLIVCAAGNNSWNTDNGTYRHFPSYYTTILDNLISVGAMNIGGGILQTMTNNDGDIIGGSNYGATTVDIFAPGQNILTCYPESLCTGHTSGTINHMYTGYHLMGQTSAAAPFVSGVAALMLAANPDLTPAQIKQIIISSATYSSNFAGKCVSDGKLNAYGAVYAAANQ